MYATIARRVEDLVIRCPSFQAACEVTGVVTDPMLEKLRDERVHWGDADDWFGLGVGLPRPLVLIAQPSASSRTVGRGAGRETAFNSRALLFLQSPAYGIPGKSLKQLTRAFYQLAESLHSEMTSRFDLVLDVNASYLAFRDMNEIREPMRTPLYESEDNQDFFTVGWELVSDSGDEG